MSISGGSSGMEVGTLTATYTIKDDSAAQVGQILTNAQKVKDAFGTVQFKVDTSQAVTATQQVGQAFAATKQQFQTAADALAAYDRQQQQVKQGQIDAAAAIKLSATEVKGYQDAINNTKNAQAALIDSTGQLATLAQRAADAASALRAAQTEQITAQQQLKTLQADAASTVDQLNAADLRLSEATKALAAAQSEAAKSAATFKEALTAEKSELAATEAALNSHATAHTSSATAVTNHAAAHGLLGTALSNSVQGLSQVTNALGPMQQGMMAAGTATGGLSLGLGALAVGVVAVGGVLAGSIKAAADFQSTIVEVHNNTTMTTADMNAMAEGVKQLALVIPQSTTAMAEGWRFAADEGFNAADSLKLVTAAGEAASNTGANVTEVTNTLAKAMHSYKLSGDEAMLVTNMLVEGAKQGQTTFAAMSASIGPLIAQAASLHVPLQDIIAAMSAMTQNGYSAEQSVTGLTNLLKEIEAPSGKAKAAIAALGAQGAQLLNDFTPAGLAAKGLYGVMQDLQTATGGDNAAILSILPQLRGFRSGVVLAGTGADDFTTAMQRQADVMSGKLKPTQDDFALTMGTVSAKMQILKNTIEVLAIDLGTVLLPIITKAVDGFLQLAQAIGLASGASGFTSLKSQIDSVNKSYMDGKAAQDAFAASQAQVKSDAAATASAHSATSEAVQTLTQNTQALNDILGQYGFAAGSSTGATNTMGDATVNAKSATDAAKEALAQLRDELNNNQQALDGVTSKINDLTTAMKAVKDAASQALLPLEDSIKNINANFLPDEIANKMQTAQAELDKLHLQMAAPDTSKLDAAIAADKQKLIDLGVAPTKAIEDQIEIINGKLHDLGNFSTANIDGAIQRLQDAMAGVGNTKSFDVQVQQIRDRMATYGDTSAYDDKIQTIRTNLGTAPDTSAFDTQIQNIRDTLGTAPDTAQWDNAIQKIKDDLGAAPDTSAFDDKIAALKSQIAIGLDTSQFDSQIQALKDQMSTAPDTGKFDDAIKALQDQMSGLGNTSAIDAQIEDLQNKLSAPGPNTSGIQNNIIGLESERYGASADRQAAIDQQVTALNLQKQGILENAATQKAAWQVQLDALKKDREDQKEADAAHKLELETEIKAIEAQKQVFLDTNKDNNAQLAAQIKGIEDQKAAAVEADKEHKAALQDQVTQLEAQKKVVTDTYKDDQAAADLKIKALEAQKKTALDTYADQKAAADAQIKAIEAQKKGVTDAYADQKAIADAQIKDLEAQKKAADDIIKDKKAADEAQIKAIEAQKTAAQAAIDAQKKGIQDQIDQLQDKKKQETDANNAAKKDLQDQLYTLDQQKKSVTETFNAKKQAIEADQKQNELDKANLLAPYNAQMKVIDAHLAYLGNIAKEAGLKKQMLELPIQAQIDKIKQTEADTLLPMQQQLDNLNTQKQKLDEYKRGWDEAKQSIDAAMAAIKNGTGGASGGTDTAMPAPPDGNPPGLPVPVGGDAPVGANGDGSGGPFAGLTSAIDTLKRKAQELADWFTANRDTINAILEAWVRTGTSSLQGLGEIFSGLIGGITGGVEVLRGIKDGDWTLIWKGIYDISTAQLNLMYGFLQVTLGNVLTLIVGHHVDIKKEMEAFFGPGGGARAAIEAYGGWMDNTFGTGGTIGATFERFGTLTDDWFGDGGKLGQKFNQFGTWIQTHVVDDTFGNNFGSGGNVGQKFDELGTKVDGVFGDGGTIGQKFSSFGTWINTHVVGDIFRNNFGAGGNIGQKFDELGTKVTTIFGDGGTIGQLFSGFGTWIQTNVVDKLTGWFGTGGTIATAFSQLGTLADGLFRAGGTFGALFSNLGTDANTVKDTLANGASGIFGRDGLIGQAFSNLGTLADGLFRAGGTFGSLFSNLGTDANTLKNTLANGASGVFGEGGLIGQAFSGLGSLASRLMDAGTGAIPKAFAAVSSAANTLKNDITQHFGEIGTALGNTFKTPMQAAANFFVGFANGAGQAANTVAGWFHINLGISEPVMQSIQLAKGTRNWQGGPAIIGEAGRELYHTGRGGGWGMADGPMLANLPKGSTVLPNHVTESLLGAGVPGFAGGLVGDILSGIGSIGAKAGDAISGIIGKGEGWAIDQVKNLLPNGDNLQGFLKDAAGGAVNMGIDGLKDLIHTLFSHTTVAQNLGTGAPPSSGGGGISGNTDFIAAIKAATSDGHEQQAMLMGAALESSLRNVAQNGGGPGAGYWQIEAGPGGQYAGQVDPYDPMAAARFMEPDYRAGMGYYNAGDLEGSLTHVAYAAERPAVYYNDGQIANAWDLIQPFLTSGAINAPTGPSGGVANVEGMPGDQLLGIAQSVTGAYLYCEKFVGDVMDAAGLRYGRAGTAREHAGWQSLNPGYGPEGAITFFDWTASDGVDYGHVGFSEGNNRDVYGTVSPQLSGSGTGILNASGLSLLGWTDNPRAGGGPINEPVLGVGLNSGQSYSFGEKGPEYVLNQDQLRNRQGGESLTFNNLTVVVQVDTDDPKQMGRSIMDSIMDEARKRGRPG